MKQERHPAYLYECPDVIEAPVLFESPHDFPYLPKSFQAACQNIHLNRQVDYHIGDLYSAALDLGMPLLRARIHRGAVIDFNRSIHSVHPDFINGSLEVLEPNPQSKYAPIGLGLVRTHAYMGSSVRIRDDNPTEAEILDKIYRYWLPYHQKIREASAGIFSQYGCRYHVSCHSFPMEFMQEKEELLSADVILGSLKGKTASAEFIQTVAEAFRDEGLTVIIDQVLSGAECIRQHGRPEQGEESLQIELTRELFMDNHTFEPNSGYPAMQSALKNVISKIRNFARSQTPRPSFDSKRDQDHPYPPVFSSPGT